MSSYIDQLLNYLKQGGNPPYAHLQILETKYLLIITIILREMKIKDILLFGALTTGANCSSAPKLASKLDESKCSVSEQGMLSSVAVREG